MNSLMPFACSPAFSSFENPFGAACPAFSFPGYWNSWAAPMEKTLRKFELDFNTDESANLRPTNFEEYRSIKTPIIEDSHGNRKMKLCFDLYYYKPAEIEIKTEKNMLTVCAKHEWKKGDNHVCRTYSRSCKIPKDVNVNEMKATFSPKGLLTIEAPLPPSPRQKSIHSPMHQTVPVKH